MIRKITKKDIAEIFDLLEISWISTYVPLGLDRKAIQARFADKKQWIANFESFLISKVGSIFVSDVGGKIVGVVFGQSKNIQALYVHPDYQGEGHGKMLLDKFIGDDKEVTLHVLSRNKSAQEFYKKNGFNPTGKYSYFRVGEKRFRDLEFLKE